MSFDELDFEALMKKATPNGKVPKHKKISSVKIEAKDPQKPFYKDPLPESDTPTAWGYARASHIDQIKTNDTVPRQADEVTKYYEYRLKPMGIAWGGVMAEGKQQSAYRKAFSSRPAGIELLKRMRRGDHLICDKVDRMFRSMDDFVCLMEVLKKMGIKVHFVSFSGCSIEIGTPMGDFFLTMFVAIAALESSRISERQLALRAHREKLGRCTISKIPGAKRFRNSKGKLRFKWDEGLRKDMAELVVRKDAGEDRFVIMADLSRRYLIRQGMTEEQADKKMADPKYPKFWTHKRYYQYYHREKIYQKLNIENPNDVQAYGIMGPNSFVKPVRTQRLRSTEDKAKVKQALLEGKVVIDEYENEVTLNDLEDQTTQAQPPTTQAQDQNPQPQE